MFPCSVPLCYSFYGPILITCSTAIFSTSYCVRDRMLDCWDISSSNLHQSRPTGGSALHVNLTVLLLLLLLFQAFVIRNTWLCPQHFFLRILSATYFSPYNIVHNIFVPSHSCPHYFFPHNTVYNIFVFSQYCPQHVCFRTLLSTSFSPEIVSDDINICHHEILLATFSRHFDLPIALYK